MSQDDQHIPTVPAALARMASLVPLFPLTKILNAFAGRIAREHPRMFRRLGNYSHALFEIDPTDLPVVIEIAPEGGNPQIRVKRKPGTCDARIAGPLAALLGMVHGAYDGDALFFSRDLILEGDTAAAIALRNAIDSAELDLGAEIEQMSGPAAGFLKQIIAFSERCTGFALTRHEELGDW